MSALPSTATWQWPTDILDFAARNQVDAYLDPLLAATRQVYPTATSVRVLLEDDPEIRDDWHIVFEVRVPKGDVPDYSASTRSWHRELFRLCPSAQVSFFRLSLVPVAS